jgi:hypothetical protein
MTFLFYVLAAVVLYIVIYFGICVAAAHRWRLRRSTGALDERDNAPSWIHEIVKPSEIELALLDFESHHWQRVESPFLSPCSERWSEVLLNSDKETYAVIQAADLPEKGAPCSVEFITLFSDGTRLNTVNGMAHRTVGAIPGSILIDPYAEDLAKQWQAHLDKLEELRAEKMVILKTPAEFVEFYVASLNDYVESLKRSSWIAAGAGNYRIRFVPAIRAVLKMVRGEKKAAALRSRRPPGKASEEPPPAELPVELEVCSFRRVLGAAPDKTYGAVMKFLVYIGVLAAFCIIAGALFGFAEWLVFWAIAIILHDLGHLAGIHVFKGGNPERLYIPWHGLLGAPDSSMQPYCRGLQKSRPHEEMIIALLGPLPGIILGLCLILSPLGKSDLVRDGASVLIIFNFANLLPLGLFDGGRLLNMIDLRIPYVHWLFHLGAALAVLVSAFFLSSREAMLVLSVLIVLAALVDSGRSRLLGKFRKFQKVSGEPLSVSSTSPPADSLLFEIFRFLREKPFDRAPFVRRFALAKFLYGETGRPVPSTALALAALVLYAALLFTPCLLLFSYPSSLGGRLFFWKKRDSGPFYAAVRPRGGSREVLWLSFSRDAHSEGAGVDSLSVCLSTGRPSSGRMKPAPAGHSDVNALYSYHSFRLPVECSRFAGGAALLPRADIDIGFMENDMLGEPMANMSSSMECREGTVRWQYMLHHSLNLVRDQAQARPTAFAGKARMEVTAMGDSEKKGSTGIAVSLFSGSSSLTCFRNGRPLNICVKVSDREGRIVLTEKVGSDKASVG